MRLAHDHDDILTPAHRIFTLLKPQPKFAQPESHRVSRLGARLQHVLPVSPFLLLLSPTRRCCCCCCFAPGFMHALLMA